MTTTKSYGTWSNRVQLYETSPEDGLNCYLGDADPGDYDMTAIYAAYRAAIDSALPRGVSLCGNEFIGPASPEKAEFQGCPVEEDGSLDLRTLVEQIEFDVAEVFDQHMK